ncbi:HAMP domain-containing protein [Actinoplanes sp. LDG1-06]|uniref:histidine kinase n=1 Tax=Paractinoplanes ovalisporus TaxID=2810368 RepID=A0ABS2AV53_9ACTN|nr:ATP-binding protein [Actinoplanes ovalisporus]MBM2623029.1 HAMP domain-containing protein [Actinoplanes ovalisporus]
MKSPRELSLRARLVLVSVLALTIGLAAGGVLLIGVLNFAMLRAINTEARETAQGVVKLVSQKQLSQRIEANPAMQVQVIDSQGRVLAMSAGADRLVPMLHEDELRGLADGDVREIPGSRIGLPGDARVVMMTAGAPTDPIRVLVARSTNDLRQGVHILRLALLVTFPLLIALLAIVLWRALGAALHPVDALRAGAEEITGGTREGRLPVPESRDEIHRLAVTLNGMLHRLESARTKQRAFVADAAHELRSPLTNMRTELEVAQRLPDTDWQGLSTDLLTDVDRLSRLVDDLLLLARADDGGGRVVAAPFRSVDLGALVGDVSDRYPSVTYVRPSAPMEVTGEPDALGRVVANLLDNAVRHAKAHVQVTVSANGTHRLITVTDDGPGIPAADRERVFDRFTRLDDARARDAGGSGLGLAIVRELVRRHGGIVTLGDAGPGLRVDVRLPALR